MTKVIIRKFTVIMKNIYLIALLLLLTSSCFDQTREEREIPIPFTPSPVDKPYKIKNPFPSQMPMHLVFPRPDYETQSHARHRWAHPAMTYEIPIGVQGGSWPFKYELIAGPQGATIGNVYDDTHYGVVRWQPNSSDLSARFHIRVTDQEENKVDAFWTVTVDASRFVFIQDEWNGDKVGSIQAPLEDVADWYKGDRSDDTYHNKIIVFREGSYKLKGGQATNGNIRLDADSKTPSLIGFPDETAVLDASSAKVITDESSLQDIFIANLRWENSRQDVKNAHFVWAIGNVSRSTWWNNYFFNHGRGIKGNDNPAGVFISSTDKHKKNILYKHNTHDGFDNGGLNGSYVDLYYASYVLIEENIAKNSNNGCGFWAKGTTSFVSIRANHAYDNITRGGICVGYGYESPEGPHDHEVAWNHIVYNSPNARYTTLMWANQKSRKGQTFNSYIYRNTFVNGSAWIRFVGKENYEVNANVVISKNLKRWNTSIMDITLPNVTGKPADSITDENGMLYGEFRAKFLGTVGHEFTY